MSRTARAGIEIHRSLTLIPADTTRESGIPCTSVARTLFDLAEVIARRPLERAFDQAETMQVFDLRAIQDQIDRNPTRPATTKVRAVLGETTSGAR